MSSNTDNNESLTIPDRVALNPTVAARYSVSEKRDGDVEYVRVGAVIIDVNESDKVLLEALRRVRADQDDFWTFYKADPLMVRAADRIEELLAWLGTEQSMHAAWRKRAEEAEAAVSSPLPAEPAQPNSVRYKDRQAHYAAINAENATDPAQPEGEQER